MTEQTQPQRALALDVLRGIAILLMVFSGRIPFGVLPDWMYHAQVPPPSHVFNPNLPGITWVDLVFPFFLFSMGAAIPLALGGRLRRGVSRLSITGSLLLRGLLLAAFAIYVMHIRPWLFAARPDTQAWVFALAGFLLLFPMFSSLPQIWSRSRRAMVRVGGWLGAILLLAFVRYPDGSGFLLTRSDIIILVLSNVAVGGGLVWLATQRNILLRLGLLGFLFAMRLSAPLDGWVHAVWNISPVPWLFQVYFLQYLFIVIPGTIVGDFLKEWMEHRDREEVAPAWNTWTLAGIAAAGLLLNIVLVIGLKQRWLVETFLSTVVVFMISHWMVRSAASSTEKLIKRLFHWSTFWVLLGLFFEVYEGGIKKDHPTMSYYFVTGGLAAVLLAALIVIIDMLRIRKPFALLIGSGQNPLVAYAGVNSLVPPVLGLLGIDLAIEALTPTPWLGALRGAGMTMLVALAAAACTRWKIFLKT